jgi:hypothetical protein
MGLPRCWAHSQAASFHVIGPKDCRPIVIRIPACCAASGIEFGVIIFGVHPPDITPLFEVGHAGNCLRLFSHPLKGGHQDCHKQRNYGNHHQKLY